VRHENLAFEKILAHSGHLMFGVASAPEAPRLSLSWKPALIPDTPQLQLYIGANAQSQYPKFMTISSKNSRF